MARIILLGDLHLGARNASNHFSEYFNKFFTDVLYPYCKKHDVKQILQLGDLFDSRTQLTYKALHKSRDIWFKQMGEAGIKMTVLLGNHDICYRHTLSINSPELLLGEYDHITIVNEPTQMDIDGIKFDIVPWICDENKKDIAKFMGRKDKGSVLLGHFELAGFPQHKGDQSNTGKNTFNMSLFEGYSLVFSGHYHTRSEKGNITYTGIPYEITWADYADPKGFVVYDTVTKQYEFVNNPYTMFEKVYYSNGSTTNIKKLKGKIVKIIVAEKKDPVAYERWLDSIRLVVPYEMNIIEAGVISMDGELDDSIQIEDTPTLIKEYISGIDTTVEKEDLIKYMHSLYQEALTLDDTL